MHTSCFFFRNLKITLFIKILAFRESRQFFKYSNHINFLNEYFNYNIHGCSGCCCLIFVIIIIWYYFMSFKNVFFRQLHILYLSLRAQFGFVTTDLTELNICGWTGTSPGESVSRILSWRSSAVLTPISKRFVSILYFKAFNKLIDGIFDFFQQPSTFV